MIGKSYQTNLRQFDEKICPDCSFVEKDSVYSDKNTNTNYILDRRVDKKSLRLVQYNVQWLYVDYCIKSDCPGSGCRWKNQTYANFHLNYVADVIREIDPDIINLCEVKGCNELNMLIKKLDKTYKPYLIQGEDLATGQNVGMLTRIDPIINLYRTPNVNKHYITEFFLYNRNIAFVSAHLTSTKNYGPKSVRIAIKIRETEAKILQNIVSEYIKKKYEVIMMGNFNDFDNIIMDAGNNIPTSNVVSILKGYGSNYELYNVADKIWKDDRFTKYSESTTYENYENYQTVSMADYILISPFLRSKINSTYINRHIPNGLESQYDSNHFPLIVDFII